MSELGVQKQNLLNQVKNQATIPLQTLVDLINRYKDLEAKDFQGYIDDTLLAQLYDACRDPKELELWNQIEKCSFSTKEDLQRLIQLATSYVNSFIDAPKLSEVKEKLSRARDLFPKIEEEREWKEINNMPCSTTQEIQALQRQVLSFQQKYPNGAHSLDAQEFLTTLEKKLSEIIEQRDWEMVERGNYNALQTYKAKYPQSVHLDELDDLMWLNTKNVMNYHSLSRYLSDWPCGRHAEEAKQALLESSEWEEVKRSGDLFRVDDYRDNHPNSQYINEVNALYFKLRDEELAKMKENPSEYSKDYVEKLIAADIFTKWQLEDEGLITDESWEMLQLDRSLFPNITEYQFEDPNLEAPAGCTDIYLFGTPGTGKTCLLMGLTGANGSRDQRGQSYTLNMRTQGGPYASALQQYVSAGITPGRTYGTFVTTINGQVNEVDKKGRILNHRINLVEMSGEEFALRIADNKEVSLSNMGTGATNLLSNENRKVFFIIVDASKEKVKCEYIEQVKDAEGNVIDERIRKKYIWQLDILNKFVGLFELPENQEIMKRVDAIHFVVTKADMLGEKNVRKEKARDLLLNTYAGPVEQLKNYCRLTKRINYSTDYRPLVFTFSLGKFYLGDVFIYDNEDTIRIVDTIRLVTGSTKEKSWWDKLKATLG